MLKEGDIVDSLGPLGTSFTMDKKHIVGVGGGVGIAPILFMARRAKEGQMTVVIGGRNKEEVFWKDLFPSTVKKLIVTTDDGSCGRKGFSISVLPELFQKDKFEMLHKWQKMLLFIVKCLWKDEWDVALGHVWLVFAKKQKEAIKKCVLMVLYFLLRR